MNDPRSKAHQALGLPYIPTPRPRTKLVKLDPPDKLKLRRMVVRFPPGVRVEMERDTMRLIGKAGISEVDLKRVDPNGTIAFQLQHLPLPTTHDAGSDDTASSASGAASTATAAAAATPSSSSSSSTSASSAPNTMPIMLCVSPTDQFFDTARKRIENAIKGVTQGYLVGLTVKGVGYKMEPVHRPSRRKRDWCAPSTAAAQPACMQHSTHTYTRAVDGRRTGCGTPALPVMLYVMVWCCMLFATEPLIVAGR